VTPILQQFLSEARDFLQSISEKLMQLENAPLDAALMNELFRLVHTLKGNCGLFDFPEMLRVLHVAEDLMAIVRDGDLAYSPALADNLLGGMDFVSMLLDEIEAGQASGAHHGAASATLTQALRQLIPVAILGAEAGIADASPAPADAALPALAAALAEVPEALRMAWYRDAGVPLSWITYTPEAECFFKGEDPFFQARQTPQIAWRKVSATKPWASLPELDAYHCALHFDLISSAPRAELEEHFRYVQEQIAIIAVPPALLVLPLGDENGGPVYEDFVCAALAHLARGDLASLARAARSMLELSSSSLWLSSALRWLLLVIECEPGNRPFLRAVIESLRTFAAPDLSACAEANGMPVETSAEAQAEAPPVAVAPVAIDTAIADAVIAAQLMVLGMPDQVLWLPGRLKAVAATLTGCYRSIGRAALLPALDAALAEALQQASAAPLLAWLVQQQAEADAAPMQEAAALALQTSTPETPGSQTSGSKTAGSQTPSLQMPALQAPSAPDVLAPSADLDPRFGRRAEDQISGPKTLKVDQEKIDRLMNLIGEMVVAKNGLPYLAARAEAVFGVRELSREIKTQYAVINRIAEEMQDAIMQVRMMSVSFVFQRFPRLVRDISRKLGKEVVLVLEGEDTEADKNIIEALADPLIHIVRNSLDHGLESPQVRRAAGKSAEGRLLIRASQEADRVVIDISDDGKGIDPAIIKRKAYEKGIIDEATLERISDQDAINLVFAAGFSTVDVVSDLSGRGVGMDVVRAAVEQVNGTVTLESRVGEGTRLRLSLPLSMAVTNVMIIESNRQIFGVPMDMVVETVRIARSSIHWIKNIQTAVLRGRIVPLRSLNDLLAADREQLPNEDDEFATLVIRMQGEHVGIVVDDFREVVDIILKPMNGVLAGLSGYAGSALMGDGSVLMVLNPKELI
jgi:two-component system chemotaxis sensor kinase CheA